MKHIAMGMLTTPFPVNDETIALAESLIWFEPPAEALADAIRFLAYAFARATHEQVKLLGSYLSADDLREALRQCTARYYSTHVPGPTGTRAWGGLDALRMIAPLPHVVRR